jgi:hypothetical protein
LIEYHSQFLQVKGSHLDAFLQLSTDAGGIHFKYFLLEEIKKLQKQDYSNRSLKFRGKAETGIYGNPYVAAPVHLWMMQYWFSPHFTTPADLLRDGRPFFPSFYHD